LIIGTAIETLYFRCSEIEGMGKLGLKSLPSQPAALRSALVRIESR
jgi:hypothetical protein